MADFEPFDGDCPECGGKTWIGGPGQHDGRDPPNYIARNYECTDCGLRINHTAFGIQRIGHRNEAATLDKPDG